MAQLLQFTATTTPRKRWWHALRCRLWHDWQRWVVMSRGNITRKEHVVGRYEYQRRECKHCSISQIRCVEAE